MKKVLSLILAAALMLGLCACGGSGEGASSAPEGLHVGYGQADIMPAMGTPLGGYGQEENRLANGMLDKLYATCLAFQDGGDIVVLFNMDAIRSNKDLTAEVRTQVSAATGVKPENIIVMSTHSHSTPELKNSAVKGSYWPVYIKGAVAAAEAAVADMAPAKLYMGSKTLEGMNFVRHYEMLDGSYAGSNFGDFAIGIKDHATVGDPELRVVKIEREGEGKNDIAICNWAAHPCFTGGSTELNIASDYIGTTRRALKDINGMDMFFIQGAAGNQNTGSQIKTEAHGLDNNSYGQKLAEAVAEVAAAATLVEGSGVQVYSKEFTYKVQKEGSDPETLSKAREVVQLWEDTDRATGNALAKKYGFHSVYHCSAIISNATRTKDEDTVHLDVTRIGGIALAHAPYEMFSNQSLYIKENSVFGENTIIATMSNHAWGYFPSAEAYAYGCYESFGAQFVSGIAEDAADYFLELLQEAKA